jgi:hypothetical protein
LVRDASTQQGYPVTDASDATHFSVTYTEAELRDVGRLIAERQARAESNYTFYGMLFAVPLAIGFIVYEACDLGLIARAAVPPALAAAYIAFVAGWLGCWLWIRSYYRKQARTPRDLGPWNFVFDAAGVLYQNETTEVRYTWRGVNAIEGLGRFILFRCGTRRIFIPARVFADNAACGNFAAACAARIKAASDTGPS